MRRFPVWMWLKIGISFIILFPAPVLLIWSRSPFSSGIKWVLISLLILAASLLVSWLFVARPIHRLIRLMEEAETDNFLKRAPVSSRDVIGQLARSFNRLLERITTLDAFKMETERKLIDAQKELRFKRVLEEKKEIIEKTNQDLEKRVKELDLIYEFSQKMVSTLDLQELYGLLDRFIGERVGFKEFTLLTCEEWRGELRAVVRVARGFPETAQIVGQSLGIQEGVTGQVMQTKKARYVPDIRSEPRYLSFKGVKQDEGSFLSIPMIFKEKIVGVLNFNRPGIDSFSPQEIRFLDTLAAGIAIALVNAGLYLRRREEAVRDELTRSYNRRHFQTVLPQEIKRARRFGQPLSLLMMDLDHFKSFNDTYGHLEGDRRLRSFSDVIGSNIRDVDMLFRFGGEEFILLLPNTAKEDAAGVAEKLRGLVKSDSLRKNSAASKELLTVSIGIASFPADGEGELDTLDAADRALYEAKRRGRDRVVPFTPALRESSLAADPPSRASS